MQKFSNELTCRFGLCRTTDRGAAGAPRDWSTSDDNSNLCHRRGTPFAHGCRSCVDQLWLRRNSCFAWRLQNLVAEVKSEVGSVQHTVTSCSSNIQLCVRANSVVLIANFVYWALLSRGSCKQSALLLERSAGSSCCC